MKGKRYDGTNVSLVVLYDKETIADSKILFATTKKIRIKPKRNKVTRRMREIMRTIYPAISKSYHIALIAHNSNVPFHTLKEEINYLLSAHSGIISAA